MNDDRKFERSARTWLEIGPTDAPDHVVEDALLAIETTSQERDLRLPWRLPTMSMQARLGAAAVIGVLAIGGGALLLSRGPQSQVGSPTQEPTPSLKATTAPTAVAVTNYSTTSGWIVFEHWGFPIDGSSTTFNNDLRQIWLVHADGTNLHELAPGTPASGKSSPDISPNGEKVVFNSWEPASQLYEVRISGGAAALLSGDCQAAPPCGENDPSYAPDGQRIAFMRVEGAGASESSVIGVRDLQTHQVTLIETTRVLLSTGDLAQPTWSPDGSQIAYHRNTQTSADQHPTKTRIEVVNVDGTNLHELPAPAGEAKAGDPDWSPDGSLIVFSTMPNHEGEGQSGSLGIFTIHPDGTGLTTVCRSCLDGGIAPSWTPDGTHIMFWGYHTWAMVLPDGSNMAHINSSKLTWSGSNQGFSYFALLQPTP
jgi:Tol biopolymer transport system component